MKKNISIICKENHILAEINCRQSLKLFECLIRDISEKCRQSSIRNVLFDLRKSTGSLTLSEKYELGEIPSANSIYAIKWAYLDNPSERADGFVGLVAGNRGIESRLFFSMDEALQWLLHHP
jgi:hypothetical protein